MAVSPARPLEQGFSSSRRMAIGANVGLTILLAAFLLIFINWISSIKYFRADVASFGNYGLSERMKAVVRQCTEPVEVSLLFTPDDENAKQRVYLQRILDYCDELERFAPKTISVTHVANPGQRERLVASISGAFGGEAEKHKAALTEFQRFAEELRGDLGARVAEASKLLEGTAWLGDFPIFANIVATMSSDAESLKKTEDAIKELTPEGGIPKYGEASGKAKTVLADLKGHLDAIVKRLGELSMLAREMARPDSADVKMLNEVASSARDLIGSLRKIVGDKDAPIPGDPARALKAFADRGLEVDAGLTALVKRVDDLARRFPSVRQHPNWSASVKMGPLSTRMEVADVLSQAGQVLTSFRLEILSVLDQKDPRKQQEALAGARRKVDVLEQNAQVCETLLTELAKALTRMDDGSRALLDAAGAGTLFKDRLASIESLSKQIEELPELKLSSVADKLKEENAVVLQTKGKIRVVEFSETFPVRESVAGGQATELDRDFRADAAVASALLSMTQEKPFATVVLTAFEPPQPPQRSPFMQQPQQSWIPLGQLSELRKRLESANFKVMDWNLATTTEVPKPEEGTTPIYLVLPPPPPSNQPMFNQQMPEKSFGEAERKIIQGLLDQDARMIFLAAWEIRTAGFFGGPPTTPPYGYAPLLKSDWGINVVNNRRITWVEPDRRSASSFSISTTRFAHMPAGGFTEHPIGNPLRGTRFLIGHACPLAIDADLPKDVSVQSILRVPQSENYIAANISELVEIFDAINNPASGGVVELPADVTYGPFDVALAAERKDEKQGRGRIVVDGFGWSLRDEFLSQPVWAGVDRLRLDPAPTENVDFVVNALYWLLDQPQWISRGPVTAPRVRSIPAAQLYWARTFVWGVWPALVFLPGIVLWSLRRR